MSANIDIINRRQDVRGIARILLCPFRLEPDINQCYAKPGRIVSMGKFLKTHRPALHEDIASDERSWFMLLAAKEKK